MKGLGLAIVQPVAPACPASCSGWLKSLRSVILIVSSMIAPEDGAASINPAHPDGEKVKAKIARRFEYNELFRRG
jgi:hypothetical protein